MMKLYTKTICPKCLWVKSELTQAGVHFEMINIDHDASAFEKITAAGIMAVPVLEVGSAMLTEMPAILEAIEQA